MQEIQLAMLKALMQNQHIGCKHTGCCAYAVPA
jgi:hypothetical protein